MSSLVHLPNNTRISLHVKPDLAEGFHTAQIRTKFGVEIRPNADFVVTAELLSGKEAGTQVAKVSANQRALLRLGSITPYKYQALVSINPEFNLLAAVAAPLMVEPKEAAQLDLVITAHKEVDLSKFDWFCRVYLFE